MASRHNKKQSTHDYPFNNHVVVLENCYKLQPKVSVSECKDSDFF